MEESNDLEQVTGSGSGSGSPSSGESGGFVHVEPIDGSSLINQDDGVVITRVDNVQYESSDLRMTEDGGNEEFVDCPDDLVSYDGTTTFVESSEGEVVSEHQSTFQDDTEDNRHGFSVGEREIFPHHYQEERQQLRIELTSLRHQLKDLIGNNPLTGGNDSGLSTDQFTSATEVGDDNLHEMISDCSRFIQLALSKQSQTEGTIRELYSTLGAKDREIEDLNTKITEHYVPQVSYIETIADRILSSLATVVGEEEEFPDTSVTGKLSHLEKNTSLLIEKHNHFLSGVEMLNQCLAEINSEYHMQTDMDRVVFAVREELVELKRRELEWAYRSSHFEAEYGKLMEQFDKGRETIEMLQSEIGKLKGDVEVEKARFSNAKEKLGLAVTRGKALVQQRDSLRQAIVEKTNEFDKCLIELNDKSSALEAAELRKEEMKQALLQRDTVLEKCEEVLALSGVSEELQSSDIVDRVTWLLESFNMAKAEAIKLQDEIDTMKEGARAKIDRLTLSLLVEAQDKSYLEEEKCQVSLEKEQMLTPMKTELLEKFMDLLYEKDQRCVLYEEILKEETMDRLELNKCLNKIANVSEELRVLKDTNESLQIDLQKSEEKAALLREKLSMAVKKGKSLVQERESMKQQMVEKNTQIEALNLELKQQEATVSDCRDQISKLSSDVEQITKVEVDLKEERDQAERFLAESNTMLQRVIEAIDDIVLPVDLAEPVEKVKWCAAYLNECQVAKAQAEQELGDVKDEAGMLTSKLTDALTTMKSLEDALSVSQKNVSLLTEEKRESEMSRTRIEEELHKAMEERRISKTRAEQEVGRLEEEVATLNNKLAEVLMSLKTLEDVKSGSEKTIAQLTEEKRELEAAKSKALEEAASQTSRFQEIFASKNSLQEELSLAENNISVLMGEKEDAERELQKVKEEVSNHAVKLDEASRTIKSLEDAMSQLQKHASQFSNENKKVQDNVSSLESEIKNHERTIMDASATIKTLEDELLKAKNRISDLAGEQKNAEQEIVALNAQLNECRQELSCKNDNHDFELPSFLDNLQVMLKDGTLLTLFKKSFEKKIGIFVGMDRHLNDIMDYIDSEQLQDYPAIEESFQLSTLLPAGFENALNTEATADDAADAEDIGSYAGKTLEKLTLRIQILTDEFGRLSTFTDELTTSLLIKLDAIRNTVPSMVEHTKALQKNVDNLHTDKQALEDRVLVLENDLLSASEIRSLFNKVNGITIPFPNVGSGDVQPHDSDPTKKLFYIVDSVNELLDQITLLSCSNKELQSTVSKQALEVDRLKEEFDEAMEDKKHSDKMKNELFELSIGLERIISEFGGDEFIGGKKSDVSALLPVLESLVQSMVLDGENLKRETQSLGVKLLETQKMAEELASKVKLLEDLDRTRMDSPDGIHERGVVEASSLPPRSEISEVQELGPIGNRAMPLVPSAAHVRTLWKGSNDHLAVNIDPESDRLIDTQETLEDKRHIFKTLHTTGLVPTQGKIVADRLDGIWVSGGQALMSRPRARLGLIAYWLVLHLWLLGTLL